MIDVTVSKTIDRPLDDVFSFVANMENEPQWHTDIVAAERVTEGEVGEGTEYLAQFRPQPMSPSQATVRIVDFESNTRIVSESDMGSMKPVLTHVFEDANGGTRVRRRIQIEMRGLMALMTPIMRMMVRRRNEVFIANLKQVLEG